MNAPKIVLAITLSILLPLMTVVGVMTIADVYKDMVVSPPPTYSYSAGDLADAAKKFCDNLTRSYAPEDAVKAALRADCGAAFYSGALWDAAGGGGK